MGKRKEREDAPCDACGHRHNHEKGEGCGVSCRRIAVPFDRPTVEASAFPSEILECFLYLGSYHDAFRCDLLQALGITHILNTAPDCRNLYKTTLIYYCLQDHMFLQFDDAIQFLEQCYNNKARVLVHGISGRNRSPAIVIAYLMKCKKWSFVKSFQWVKDRRPLIELSTDVQEKLLEYEKKIFGSHQHAIVQPFGFDSLHTVDYSQCT